MAMHIEGPDRFVESSAQMQAYASRTSQLLVAIENTVRSLSTDVQLFRAVANEIKKTTGLLCATERDTAIDPSGRVSELLHASAAAALRLHNDGVRKRAFAIQDPELEDDDGVVDSYDEFIDAAADLHNAIEDLRDTVESLDAALEPSTGKQFESVDALIADLLK